MPRQSIDLSWFAKVSAMAVVATFALSLPGTWAEAQEAVVSQPAPEKTSPPTSGQVAPVDPVQSRELLVPFRDLHVLLTGPTRRVFLEREEYERLLAKARRAPEDTPPQAGALTHAEYTVTLVEGRATLFGRLDIQLLADELQAIGFSLSGATVRSAMLDGQPAPLGVAENGQLVAFVSGKGRHVLELDMQAIVETSAALQTLPIQLPLPASARMNLVAPGNVEVKSGAAVIRREVDDAAGVTRFELLPSRHGEALVLTLNNRQLLQRRMLLARSVMVDEVTRGYERLHAMVSYQVLHGAADRLQLDLPAGFEVTEVKTPLLARWSVLEAAVPPDAGPDVPPNSPRILEVQLTEPVRDGLLLEVVATRPPMTSDAWQFPRLSPRDVAGHSAVIGLLAEQPWQVQSVATEGLVPIDVGVLAQAFPASVATEDGSAPLVRPLVAFFAPQATYGLQSRFYLPPAQLRATSNFLLRVEPQRWRVLGNLGLVPEVERLFTFDFAAPMGWTISKVTNGQGQPLRFDVSKLDDDRQRVHVTFPNGVSVNTPAAVQFEAERTPTGWLGDWSESTFRLDFPWFRVLDATREDGAVALLVDPTYRVVPAAADSFQGLTPLDDNEKPRFGLAGIATDFAYRYESQPYAARFDVERVALRMNARTHSFLKLDAELLTAHYEVVYDIQEGSAQRLFVELPASTPESLVIRGAGSTVVKEFGWERGAAATVDGPGSGTAATSSSANADAAATSQPANPPASSDMPRRRWWVLLAEPATSEARLHIDFAQPLTTSNGTMVSLPIVRAATDTVSYQSGLVSVEGHADLDIVVSVNADGPGRPRKVDVGELAVAEYVVGKRLLGAYGFSGETPELSAEVHRRPTHPLPEAIVQRAELVTLIGANGRAVTVARYELRIKTSFLELRLPAGASLWGAQLDGSPIAPQRAPRGVAGESSSAEGGLESGKSSADSTSVLVSIPAGPLVSRDLRIVYEQPVPTLDWRATIAAAAPQLWLRDEQGEAAGQVLVADVLWRVRLPSGYRVAVHGGTVYPDQSDAATRQLFALRRSPWVTVAKTASDWSRSLDLSRVMAERQSSLARLARGNRQFGLDVFDGAAAPSSAPMAAPQVTWDESSPFGGSGLPPPGGMPGMPGPQGLLGGPGGAGMGMGGMGGMPGAASGPEPPVLAVQSGKPAAETGALPQSGETPNQPADPLAAGGDKADAKPQATARTLGDLAEKRASQAESEGRALTSEKARGADSQNGPEVADDLFSADANPGGSTWALQGMRSLPIDMESFSEMEGGDVLALRSLGHDPAVELTLVHQRRLVALSWGIGFLAAAWGVARSRLPWTRRVTWLVSGLLLVSAIPVVVPWNHEVGTFCDSVFFALLAVAAWYMALGALGGIVHLSRRMASSWKRGATSAAVASVILMFLVGGPCGSGSTTVMAQNAQRQANPVGDSAGLAVTEAREELRDEELRDDDSRPPLPPVKVPADVVIIPYDHEDPAGTSKAQRLLVPYDKYVELWNLAYPDRKLSTQSSVATHAWAGAEYQVELRPGDDVLIRGKLRLQVFDDAPLDVPLSLSNAVFTSATVDGSPARIRVVQPQVEPMAGGKKEASAGPVIVLSTSGKGIKVVELTLRMKQASRGGLRVVQGQVPTAPATSLQLSVPEARTEVTIGSANEIQRFETKQAGEKLESVIGRSGMLQLSWRPKVAMGEVDRSLTAQNDGEIDVREDAIRLVWRASLEFRGGQRDSFTFLLPDGYQLERVVGDNVRAWQTRDGEGQARVDVDLLKPATDREQITLVLSRRGAWENERGGVVSLPAVVAEGAALQQGLLVIRRSPLLQVRVGESRGLTRAEIPAASLSESLQLTELSPLGLRNVEALRFQSRAYEAKLEVVPVPARVSAELRALLKVDQRQATYECLVVVRSPERPVHQLLLDLPEGLELEHVSGPNPMEWSVRPAPAAPADGNPAASGAARGELTLLLGVGQKGDFEIALRGRLPWKQGQPLPVPRLALRDVERHEGDLVVQVDPSVDVRPEQLRGCEPILLSRTFGWLRDAQRPLARLALHHRTADFAGQLVIAPRQPRVSAFTVTNVRVTGRSIEETVMIELKIIEAGIREIVFTLPASLRDARISSPLLRQRRIEPLDGADEGRVRVRLELQDEVMGQFRVLIEQDRLLTAERQEVPLPIVETGRTEQRFVTLESASRDELVVEKPEGFEPITRQQQAWARLAEVFGDRLLEAYQAKSDVAAPRLGYRAQTRASVETVGARIALADTDLVLDESGAYRAKQTYQVDNGTEQFLVVELPGAAELWTAKVAGEPVRPQRVPDVASPNVVRIPLVKTAAGDLDYPVVLTYGGKMPPLTAWTPVRFPFLKTRNIQVELSRVRLRLPESHRWLQFEGSLGQVREKEEYEASWLDYQTRRFQRLIDTLASEKSDSLTRLRSQSNLKQLGLLTQPYRSVDLGKASSNAEYNRNLLNFNSTYEQAQQKVGQEEALRQQQSRSAPGNRERLNDLFDQQDNKRARNVATQLEANFAVINPEAARGTTGGTNGQGRFDVQWFRANGFQTSGPMNRVIMNDEESSLAQGERIDAKGNQAPRQQAGKAAEQLDALRQDLRSRLQGQAADRFGEGRTRGRRAGGKGGSEENEVRERYQMQLESQNAMPKMSGEEDATLDSRRVRDEAATAGRNARTAERESKVMEESETPAPTDTVMPGLNQATDPNVQASTQAREDRFLTSLDVDLPEGGNEYLFRTPRGDLEITVQAVSTSLVDRLTRLAIVVVLATIVAVPLRRLAQSRRQS